MLCIDWGCDFLAEKQGLEANRAPWPPGGLLHCSRGKDVLAEEARCKNESDDAAQYQEQGWATCPDGQCCSFARLPRTSYVPVRWL